MGPGSFPMGNLMGNNPMSGGSPMGGNPMSVGSPGTGGNMNTPSGMPPLPMPMMNPMMNPFLMNPMMNPQAQNSSPPEERFATQLVQLQEMGFYDASENIRALSMTNGNVEAAVEWLFSHPPGTL